MKRGMISHIIFVSLALASCQTYGGVVIKKDGTVLYGQILSENEKEVVISLNRKGMTVRALVPRVEIESIDAAAVEPVPSAPASPVAPARPNVAATPTYFPIPISGVIGKDVTAAKLLVGVREARAAKAGRVIFIINSSGGSIEEMERIVDLIGSVRKELDPVAHVRQALSAGSIIAMSCPTIIMCSDATIGATVPYTLPDNGTPQAVSAKFLSAFTANCRATAGGGRTFHVARSGHGGPRPRFERGDRQRQAQHHFR